MVNASAFLIAALTLVSGVVAKSIQPPAASIHQVRDVVYDSRASIQVERMTNAKRLAAGLTPLPPARRHHADIAARTGAVQPMTSPVPGHSLEGYIQISNANTGEFLGYVGKKYALYGEYGPVQKIRQALKVTLPNTGNKKSGPLQMLGQNGDSSYPNLGGVVGYASKSDDLSKNNSNYVYIAGVQQTAPLAKPAAGRSSFADATGATGHIESAVWYFNTNNRKITFGWINTDGSLTNAKLTLYEPDNVLLAVGDLPAFRAEFGGPSVPVALTLVGA